MWEYRARVTRIVDGDTIDVEVDLGFTARVAVRVRLEGVYAVESSHPRAGDVVEAVRAWLADHASGVEWPVVVRTARLKSDRAEVTTLARYVATVTDREGASLNAYMRGWLAAEGLTGGIGM